MKKVKKKKAVGSLRRAADKTGRLSTRKLPAWKAAPFSAVVCCLFFVLLELTLALLGVRSILYEQDPYVGFSSHIPLFVRDESHPESFITAKNKLRFFNLQRFPSRKAGNAYRIFCMGGSTTYGHPYDDTTSFCGWMRSMLPVADPSRQWELVNCGGISYASYRAAMLMEELVRYQPDLFAIYTGQNEFLEQRTYGPIIAMPRVLRGVGAILSKTRLYAALQWIFNALRGMGSQPSQKGNNLPAEVDTLLDRSVGPELYHRDDELQKRVVDHYKHNLARMIDIAGSVGAKVILVKPGSNLRDCSPFKSEHRSGLTEADRKTWQGLLDRARAAQAARQSTEALEAMDQARAIDDRYAALHFLRGQVLWELGRFDEARSSFSRAIDEDVCPLRALTAIQEGVAEVAAQRGVPLVDFAKLVENRSLHGISGNDWFLDHVHPTIEGYRLLALALIESMVEQGIVHPVATWGEASIQKVKRSVENRIDTKAHAIALRNLSKVIAWAGKVEEAFKLSLRGVELAPGDATVQLEAGKNAAALGRPDEAIRYCEKALEINPRLVEARGILAGALAEKGALMESISQYRQALEIEPGNAELHCNLGSVLASRGSMDAAMRHFQRALEILPDYAEAHSNLGWLLKDLGRIDEALSHFWEAARLKPGLIVPNAGLAWILATHPDPRKRDVAQAIMRGERAAELSEYRDWMGLDALAAAYAASGRYPDAVKTVEKALALARFDASERVPELAERLLLYRQGKPYSVRVEAR